MYREYWGLSRSPFDSVPDPGMYFKMHSSVENSVAEILFAIEEGNECLAVIVGEVGLGKTMALRVVLDALDAEKYRIAFVTNPDLTFPQLLREIIGQLKGEASTTRGKERLLEEFNRILFETIDSGKKVLVFIDEGNALKGANLESLRLLTNMQEDTRNLFTIILAGQPKLARMLEDPRRANLFQRIGVYSRLEPLGSAELVRDYIDHRLERSGCTKKIFTDAAIEAIYEHSKGIPRIINKLCKLSLKAGETNELKEIDAELINDIAARFERISSRKKRRREREEISAPTEPAAVDALPPQPVPPAKEKVAVEPALASLEAFEDIEKEKNEAVAKSEATAGDAQAKTEPREEAGKDQTIQVGIWAIPAEVLEKVGCFPDERSRLRYAGQVAARQLKEHPEKLGEAEDPVEMWKKLRFEILNSVKKD